MPKLSFPYPLASLSLFHNIVTWPPFSSLSPGFLFHFFTTLSRAHLSLPSPQASLSLFHNIGTCPSFPSLSLGLSLPFSQQCIMPTFPFPLLRHPFPFFTTLSHAHLSLPSPLAFLSLFHNIVTCPPFPSLNPGLPFLFSKHCHMPTFPFLLP